MQAQFLRTILPELPPPDAFGYTPVYYAIGLGEYPKQAPCSSIDTIIQRCNEWSRMGQNAYMALGSFRDPLAGRKQNNALAFRCMWADIDVGKPGCKYSTQQEARDALGKFIIDTALIPTYLVSSGAGLHVYWCFDKNIDAHLWKQVALLFQKLCKQQGLDVDPARATDTASILRLPGTIHTKTGNLVTILHRSIDISKPDGDDSILYKPIIFVNLVVKHLKDTVTIEPAPAAPNVVVGSGLADLMGMGPEAPKAEARPIVMNCPQMIAMGINSYPAWFAGMTVLRRCVDGLEWAHKLSALDKNRYDPADTERKFNQANVDMPAKCDTFERIAPQYCAECKYRGLVKSPVQLHRLTAQPVKAQAEVVPAGAGHLVFPAGWNTSYTPISSKNYLVTDAGIIHVSTEKRKDGTLEERQNLICTSKLMFKYSEVIVEDKRPHRSYVFDAIHPTGETEEVRYIVDEDSGPQKTMDWFNNAKMYPTHPNLQGQVFMGFMNAYLQSVVHHAKELRTYKSFGWVDDFVDPNTKQPIAGFLTGDGIVTAHGVYEAGYYGDSRKSARIFTHKGTLDEWKYVPQMYRVLDQKICQLALCFSFAAPLMRYGVGEARNCLFNIWSGQGGVGKSTLLRIAASVWGNPKESFFAKDTTFAAKEQKLSVWNNIPAMMDELTETSDEAMTNLAFAVVSGKQREKMSQGGKALIDTGDWETCTFTTANKSFKECIARRHADTDAATKRVMDYEWDCQSYEGNPQALKYITTIGEVMENNYGMAGPEFLYQLMLRPDKLDGLRRFAGDWAAAKGFKGDERFMAYPLAIALQAGRWAVEFGLLDYDMDALEKWVLNVFVPHNRAQTEMLKPDFKEMMVEYLNDRAAAHMLVVKSAVRGAKEIDPGVANMPDAYVLRHPQRELYARYEKETRLLQFMRSDFTNWCKNRGVSAMLILNELDKNNIFVEQGTARLARNVSAWAVPRCRCMTLNAESLGLLGYNEDDLEV